MTRVLSSSAERRICAIPCSRAEIQTLVARKARLRARIAASKSPTTASARPYIGEVSITDAPPSNSACRIARRLSRAAALPPASPTSPASNVCQVPSPITGSISPLFGIGRASIAQSEFIIAAPCKFFVAPANATPLSAAALSPPAASLRKSARESKRVKSSRPARPNAFDEADRFGIDRKSGQASARGFCHARMLPTSREIVRLQQHRRSRFESDADRATLVGPQDTRAGREVASDDLRR